MIVQYKDSFDKDTGRVVIQSDSTPENFPTTGADVDGLPDDFVLAPGSLLIALEDSEKYILGEDGTWYKWG